MNLVFDIETVGFKLEELEESQQEFILRQADKEKNPEDKEEKKDEAVRMLSLYPLTSKVVTIALLNTETEGSMVLFEDEFNNEEWNNTEKNIRYKGMSEKEILLTFWDYVSKADKVITFNGRGFDIPFVMIRSAIHRIKPTKDFMGNRFSKSNHIDLLELFSFYGGIRRFNLDFYCKAFGIESPKSKGVTGMEVPELYRAGKIKEIAIYCADDIRATYELYKIWDQFLNI